MKKHYDIIKIEGKEEWDIIGTVKNPVWGRRGMKVGTIKHDHDAGEYRYYQSWRINTPNGTRQELHETIAKKLGELNK